MTHSHLLTSNTCRQADWPLTVGKECSSYWTSADTCSLFFFLVTFLPNFRSLPRTNVSLLSSPFNQAWLFYSNSQPICFCGPCCCCLGLNVTLTCLGISWRLVTLSWHQRTSEPVSVWVIYMAHTANAGIWTCALSITCPALYRLSSPIAFLCQCDF